MSKQEPVRDRKPLEQPDDTTIGTQPWTAWVVALLGLILVVIVVFLALDRAQTTARRQAAQQSVPVVGGLVVQPIPTADATARVPLGQAGAVPMQVTATLGAIVLAAETPTPVAEEETDAPAAVALAEATAMAEEEEPGAMATAAPVGEEVAGAVQAPTEAAPTETPLTPTPTVTPRAAAPAHVPAVAPVVVTPGDGLRGEVTGVRLYADADPNAAVLDAAAALAGLTVVEPSGDFEAYPVLRFGHNWARVRAADGLVGWVIIDNLERVP